MRAWAELVWAVRRAKRPTKPKRVHIPMADQPVYPSDEGLT